MRDKVVTLFGGTGFVGTQIVKRLAERGATIRAVEKLDPIPMFFGEDQGRYLVTLPRERLDWFLETRMAGVDLLAPWIGTTGGSELKLGNARGIAVSDLKAAHESWFPAFMDN